MAFPVAAVIGAVASLAGSAMAANQANLANAQQMSAAAAGGGDDDGFEPATNKYTSTLTSLNSGQRPPLFHDEGTAAATRQRVESPLKAGIQGEGYLDQIKGGGAPSGNVFTDAASGGGGEKAGLNMDQALQYAALAAQLGSMFAPPPPPSPPPAGGGMRFDAQPFTMRMLGGR